MTNNRQRTNSKDVILLRSPAFAAPVLAPLSALSNAQIKARLDKHLSISSKPQWTQACASQAYQSAVLILLIGDPVPQHVLFTMRTRSLSSHAGQISFPGGRAEPDDASLIATALRETHEEVGISPQQLKVLGMMPTLYAHTGYLITPIVATLPCLPVLSLQSQEVDHAFTVPFDFLCNPKNHHYYRLTRISEDAPILHSHTYAMQYGDWDIWGLSALIVRRFYALLASSPE